MIAVGAMQALYPTHGWAGNKPVTSRRNIVSDSFFTRGRG